ncbi:hypothetical protein [Aliiroseovarius crassostreae]
MTHLQNGYRGLSLLVDLNLDRFLFAGAILAGLSTAAALVN